MGKNIVDKLKNNFMCTALAGSLFLTGCQTASDTSATGTGVRAVSMVGIMKGGNPLFGGVLGLLGEALENEGQIQGQQEAANHIVNNMNRQPNQTVLYIGTSWQDYNRDKYPDINEVPLNINPKMSDTIYIGAQNTDLQTLYTSWEVRIKEKNHFEQTFFTDKKPAFTGNFVFKPYSFTRTGEFTATWFVDGITGYKVSVGSISFKVEE